MTKMTPRVLDSDDWQDRFKQRLIVIALHLTPAECASIAESLYEVQYWRTLNSTVAADRWLCAYRPPRSKFDLMRFAPWRIGRKR